MRSIFRGCLVVAVVVATGMGVAFYLGYRSARRVMDSAADYMARAGDVASASDRLERREPYAPPASGELTAQQVDRFLAVQARVREALDSRWSDLRAKSEALRRRSALPGQRVSVADVMDVLSDATGIYTSARRAQVVALNIQKFSAGEYAWVRLRVYEAAGLQLAGSLDLSAFETMVREGEARTGLQVPELPRPKVPQTNRELVAPHVAKLTEWLPMAFLGL